MAASPGLHNATQMITLPSGVRAVFPAMGPRDQRGRISAMSSAFGCYGGAFADGPLSPEDEMRVLRTMVRSVRTLSITENPLAPGLRPVHRFAVVPDFTDMLRLSDDPERVHGSFSKTRRYEIRRGRANGVETRIACSLADYRAYFAVYEESLRRWGKPADGGYPWKLFEVGYKLAQEYPAHLRLWLGEHDGQIMAGAWIFYWNRIAVYWHGAALASGLTAHAPSVALADAIDDACRGGFDWFDFNPSGGHEGVAAFKTQFGTERRTIRRFAYRRSFGNRVTRRI